MDRTSLIGVILILAGVIGGQLLEGGALSSLLQPTAFLIVVVGTLGAVALQSPKSHLLGALKMARWVLFPPSTSRQQLLAYLLILATVARKEGVLHLERFTQDSSDPFSQKALRMLIDNISPSKVEEVLHANIDIIEARQLAKVKVWESAGGYAPTIGILGAVLGLIHVMENLGDPAILGSGIAIAFVATVYGVGFANLVLLPVGQKLRTLVEYEIETYEMLTVGFVSIANNENPRLLTERCSEYLDQ